MRRLGLNLARVRRMMVRIIRRFRLNKAMGYWDWKLMVLDNSPLQSLFLNSCLIDCFC